MIESNCKWRGVKIIRGGNKAGVFCSLDCKGEWQRTQKPVKREWLYRKYVTEGLSTYQIAKLVKRDSKTVWRWLKGFEIETRPQPGGIRASSQPYWGREWLYNEYVFRQRSSSEIATDCGCHENNILYFLNKYNIPTRTMSEVREVKYWGVRGKDNPMFGVSGEDNPNWRGGKTPERQEFYSSIEWRKSALSVWQRDRGICRRCGAKAQKREDKFHIHHIVSFQITELRTELSNLILLCPECHWWVHSNENKDNEFIEEYQEGGDRDAD